jgi:predicted DNA-binding transcriptional regulator YafY
VHDIADVDGWVRVRLRAERLDWVPAVLAGMGLPFAVEHPEALRGLVQSLAERLAAAAAADTIHTGEPTPDSEAVDPDST